MISLRYIILMKFTWLATTFINPPRNTRAHREASFPVTHESQPDVWDVLDKFWYKLN